MTRIGKRHARQLTRRQREDRRRIQQRIGELLDRETWEFLVALRDQLERRMVCPPPAIDRAAIAAEVDERLAGDEFFDVEKARARQSWYVGEGNESARLVVEFEDPRGEDLHRVIERVVVGRIGVARALAIEAAALAESFSGRFPEME